MKHILLSFLLCISTFVSAKGSLPLPNALPLQKYEQPKISFKNDILTKINGKAISALDIKKRLDFMFNRQFSDLASSASARFQFYKINWSHMLNEAINRELILADAKEKDLQINDSDIRQELEEIFGPDVLETIDLLKITYDKAWEMTRNDILVRRMMIYRVHQKTVGAFTPEDVYAAYQAQLKSLTPPTVWKYRVLSIRHEDSEKALEYAQEAYFLLQETQKSLEELVDFLSQNFGNDNPSFSVRLSSSYEHTDKTLSKSYQTALLGLSPGEFSQVTAQSSRQNGSPVFRIFMLEDYTQGKQPPFVDLEEEIKNKLLDTFILEETNKYLSGLRTHYGLDDDRSLSEALSTTSIPFSLQ